MGILRRASGLLVSDYGYGSTDATEVEFLRRRAVRLGCSIPFTVDSRFGLRNYARVTAAAPNEPEVEEAFGQRINNNLELLHRLGRRILQRQSLQSLLITRGRDGMVLFEARRKPQHIPIFGSDQAVDVTGAGDTVIAAFDANLDGLLNLPSRRSRVEGASWLELMSPHSMPVALTMFWRCESTDTRSNSFQVPAWSSK